MTGTNEHRSGEDDHRLSRRTGAEPSSARALLRAIQEGDGSAVEAAVVRRAKNDVFLFAGVRVVASVMFFQGLVTGFCRTGGLTPSGSACDVDLGRGSLKVGHVFKGKELPELATAWRRWQIVVGIVSVTVVSFYLNAVFAFAILLPGKSYSARASCSPGVISRGPRRRIHRGGGTRDLAVVVSLGPAVVRPQAGNRRRRDDVDLCERSGPARSGTTNPIPRRDKLRRQWLAARSAALVRTLLYALGRIRLCCSGSHVSSALGVILAPRARSDAAGGRDRRGEGDQDEGQAACGEGLAESRIGRKLDRSSVRARDSTRWQFRRESTAGLESQTPGRAPSSESRTADLGSRARLIAGVALSWRRRRCHAVTTFDRRASRV